MRIGHYYAPQFHHESGVTASISQWSRAQRELGHDVVWMNDGRGAPPSPEFRTVSVHHTGSRRLTSAPLGLSRWVGGCDLVYLHEGWTLGHLVAGRACRQAGTPYVLMPHGVYEPGILATLKPPRALRTALERRLLEGALATHVFFASEYPLVTDVAPGAAALIAPTGANLPDDSWGGGGGYVAWFGRYDPDHKGLDLLLRGLANVPADARPQLRLRGYDYQGGKSAVEDLVLQLALTPWVNVGGEVRGDEKITFLSDAACYVHPSRWESHSIALIEVLGMGTPTLVSAAIHIAPVLAAAEAAVPVDATIAAWADALGRVGQSGVPHGIGARGRSFVRDRLSWNVVMKDWSTRLTGLGVAS